MEIFVNIDASSKKYISELQTFLSIHENYQCEANEKQHMLDFMVIDNSLKRFSFEETIRSDRQLSHYIVVAYRNELEELLKMIKNEIFTRSNSGKPEYSLVDFEAFEPMVRVLEAGAKKYDRDNWRKGNLDKQELLKLWDSFFRHAKDIKKGIETNDPEKIYDKDLGINHIGNAMCNLMFLSYHLIENGNQEIFKPK
jgi:hypothetical protein